MYEYITRSGAKWMVSLDEFGRARIISCVQ